LRCGRAEAGDADRNGLGTAEGAAAGARFLAVDRAAAGNIDTRCGKGGERGLDAIVLVACGSTARLAGDRARFDPETMLPEAGQGALALQVRAGDEQLVSATDDPETRERVEAERAVIAAVGGGCLAPVAAYHDGSTLTGLVAAEDGSWIERYTGHDPAALGAELADASTRHA
jgi:hydroxymethylbilane synthase